MFARAGRCSRLAWPLGMAGLAALAVYHWRVWRHDRLAAAGPPAPLPPFVAWPTEPWVSVVVVAWNQAGSLNEFVRSFQALNYPFKHLVLCAGGDDDSFLRARGWAGPHISVIKYKQEETWQQAVQRCMRQSLGVIVVLADVEALLDSQSFARLIYPLAAGQATVTTAGVRPRDEQLDDPFVRAQWAVQRLAASANGASRNGANAAGQLGRITALSRRALERIWAADTADVGCSLDELGRRLKAAGQVIVDVPEAAVAIVFPVHAPDYVSQVAGRLHARLAQGRDCGDEVVARQVLQRALHGSALLALPVLAIIVGGCARVFWLLGWAAALGAPVRAWLALAAGENVDENREASGPRPASVVRALLTVTLADALAASRVLGAALRPPSLAP